MRKSIWVDRLPILEELLTSGKTLREVGEHFGVSKQRIEQVVRKLLPHLTCEDYGISKRTHGRAEALLEHLKQKYNRATWKHATDLSKAHSAFFTRKKQNCKYGKWAWDILPTDVEYPTHCPVLGIELDWFAESRQENSPSLDRLDSNKGYIKGNVAIISWRASRIKNNGTKDEHYLIYRFLDDQLP